MKRTISVWACLAIVATSQLVAGDSVTTIIKEEPTTKVISELSTIERPPPAKALLSMIPNTSLLLNVDTANELLEVTLQGDQSEKLDWVLFQPKVGVVSRINTASKINKIKISALQPGEYVLMIKDAEGRALFETFKKS